jgi:hypothetical protein
LPVDAVCSPVLDGQEPMVTNVRSQEASLPHEHVRAAVWQHRRSGHPTELTMHPRFIFPACIVLLAVSAAGATEKPDMQQVQEWWKAKSPEEMTIEDPLHG